MTANEQSIAPLQERLGHAKARFEQASVALAPKHKGGEWEEYRAAYADLLSAERDLAAAKGEEHAVTIDFPVAWCAGSPLPFLLQNEHRKYLTFFVKESDPNWDGTHVIVRNPAEPSRQRIAVVGFRRCLATKMGSPNDEVLRGHPLYGKGLESYRVQQVINSRWLAEIEKINSVHSQYNPDFWRDLRHYIFWFHDSTFECIAESFHVELADKSLAEVLAGICQRLLNN
jgi:hypothetical protein